MRPIDADALIRTMRADPLYFVVERYNVEGPIHAAPTIDAVPVIRCKECIHHHGHDCENMNYRWTSDDFYCGWAERKEE